MALFSSKSWEQWIAEYSLSHQHPTNRLCHTIGIPMILVSLISVLLLFVDLSLWPIPVGLFVVGWIFQFVGHVFEKKLPEFFHDWRFLFVGARWWIMKTFR